MANKTQSYKYVRPFKVDNVHVHIKCPYCKEIHIHGSGGGNNYEGHRVAHCMIKPNEVSVEYYIKTMTKKNDQGEKYIKMEKGSE